MVQNGSMMFKMDQIGLNLVIVKKGGHPNVALVDESQVDSRGGHRNLALAHWSLDRK